MIEPSIWSNLHGATTHFPIALMLVSTFCDCLSLFWPGTESQRVFRSTATVTIVLPEFVPAHWWEHLLHNQTALRLKAALLFHPGVIVANVPYHLAH